MLAAILTDFKDAIMSGMTGTTRPANLQAGGMWIDTTNQSSPTYYWSFKVWTGTVNIEIFRLNVDVGYGGALVSASPFEVHRYGADVTGPIFQLIKQRRSTANNGQILDGDVVGEIRMVGRTDTSTDPVVAKMIFTASDNNTTSAYGGSLGFYSTPDATAALTQHLRFISGVVEITVPHKLNSERLVTQNIATAATIAALDATYVGVEMTGSTATSIQGIDATGNTREIMIHNRSSAVVTLKHENSSATATNRLTLPGALDVALRAQDSAVLIYCTTDARWKLKSSTSRMAPTRSIDTVTISGSSWTAPANVARVRIVTNSNVPKIAGGAATAFLDQYGNAFAWGVNTDGSVGDGTVVHKSSPVTVLGGLQFKSIHGHSGQTNQAGNFMAITPAGVAYAWGVNTNGQLGLGDVTPRSSPVAVLGGLKFQTIKGDGGKTFMGLTTGGTLYAWGLNTFGQLGVGNVVPRSSPVAVLGSLNVRSFNVRMVNDGLNFRAMSGAVDINGVAYAWGYNGNGQLGVGNTTDRSSPVAVLGGLTFSALKYSLSGADWHCLGLTTSGALYAWGGNSNGQLGVGDVTPRSSPVAVLGGLTFVDFGAGSNTSFGITSDGTLYMWGLNSNGELGNGGTTPRSSPVAVTGSISFRKVVPGGNAGAFVGLASDGTIYTWGFSGNGLANSNTPTAKTGVYSDFTVLTPTADTAIALKNDGSVYAWGYNNFGNVGDSSTTDRTSPVAVSGVSAGDATRLVNETTLAVTAGNSYTVVLGDCECFFGTTPIGTGINKITIEYET
jgi:alpha-tubulin suppressor-like RCC1 family protein